MSSPEVEKFEITEDDLANEFYPRGGRRQTKNQAIYGKSMEFSLCDWEKPNSYHESTRYKKNTCKVTYLGLCGYMVKIMII